MRRASAAAAAFRLPSKAATMRFLRSWRVRLGNIKLATLLTRRALLLAMAALLLLGYAVSMTRIGSSLSSFRQAFVSPPPTAPPTAPPQPTEPPSPKELEKRRKIQALRQKCYDERDYGMIQVLRDSASTSCENTTGIDPDLHEKMSTFTHFYSAGPELKATLVTNFMIDLRNAQIFKPIQNLSQDGGSHDPRFKYTSVKMHCICNQNQDYTTTPQVPRVWEWMFGNYQWDAKDWKFCDAIYDKHELENLQSGLAIKPWNQTLLKQIENGQNTISEDGYKFKVHHIKTNAILMARKDDHNPFFMISAALNAWIMMKVMNWDPENTQLVYFDDAFPTPMDEIQRRLLAPVLPVVPGKFVMGSVLQIDKALIAPTEFRGPMMRHLDDDEPCKKNALITDFRDLTMQNAKISREKKDFSTCTITIITRRPYHGRMVQRKWLNEDAIMSRMEEEYVTKKDDKNAFLGIYKYGKCKFQSLEFVDLSLDQQMRVIVESDIVIGMHGAGMVNVLWARPETVVVEIFPKHRHRWGFRNICFYVGCQYFQFRGGKEIGKGKGDNSSDKLISYADWFKYFDPIMRKVVGELEQRVAHIRGE